MSFVNIFTAKKDPYLCFLSPLKCHFLKSLFIKLEVRNIQMEERKREREERKDWDKSDRDTDTVLNFRQRVDIVSTK